jgi:sulfate transport system ATP-binding protein
MSIALEHLTKRYGTYPVVNRVSLQIAEGELFVLLGPSGSGKSTILRIIGGLTEVDAGRVLLHGHDVTRLAPQQRNIGFVFQHYALFQHLTVAENVEFGLRVRRVDAKERRRRRDELLDLVGLAGLGERLPRQLSGGQQQRVALARALAPKPAILLLDEPFDALDAKIRVDMRRSLREIQRELGITTIFVTHDQEEAFELGDRLGIMNAGRLLEMGAPDELYLRPQTEFAATFLGSANLLIGESTANAVQVGPLKFTLHTEARTEQEARRVQVLFRPEDVALESTREALGDAALGQGEVEHTTFAGTFERIRLRVPKLVGVRPIAPAVPFGSDCFLVDAVRSQDQARRHPLRAGDSVWVGVRRVHALAHPGLSFMVVADGTPEGEAALALGGQIARLGHAHVTVVGAGMTEPRLRESLDAIKAHVTGLPAMQTRTAQLPVWEAVRSEAEQQQYDMVAVGVGAATTPHTVEQLLEAGPHHLLLVPQQASTIPSSILVSVSGGEPSKDDVQFTGRLMRHLGAEATLLRVLAEEDSDDRAERWRTERFLEAGVRTLSLVGVAAKWLIRHGELREVIRTEMARGNYGMLVLGAPLRPMGSARIQPLLTGDIAQPVLVVRSPYAAASLAQIGSGNSGSLVEEMFR